MRLVMLLPYADPVRREERFELLKGLGTVVVLTLTVVLVSLAWTGLAGRPDLAGPVLAASLVVTLTIWYTWIFIRKEEEVWVPAAVALGLVAGQALGTWIVGRLEWFDVLTAISAVALALWLTIEGLTFEEPRPPLLVGLMLSAIIGGAAGGIVWASLGPALFLFVLLVLVILAEDFPLIEKLASGVNDVAQRHVQGSVEWTILSPVLLLFVAFTGSLPLRWSCFLKYATEALLLKRPAGDVEFMHRLLRDYFAMLRLRPQLGDPDADRRLEAIGNLGYQGESALEALAEFARDPDPCVREAAVSAFVKIASPQVVGLIEAALQDPEPNVRRAVVLGFRNPILGFRNPILGFRNPRGVDYLRLAQSMFQERSLAVLTAFLDVLPVSDYYYSYNQVMIMDIIFMIINNNPKVDELLRRVVIMVARGELRDSLTTKKLPKWAQETLPGFLADPDPVLRSGAVAFLSQTADRSHVARIAELLRSDKQRWVRISAARALGQLGDAQAVEPLIAALADRDSAVRVSAAGAGPAGRRAGRRAADRRPRRPGLGRARQRGRALGQLGDAQAVEPLIKALDHWWSRPCASMRPRRWASWATRGPSSR